jgi:hypothetical protein
VLQLVVAAGTFFLVGRNGVQIRRSRADRHVVASHPRLMYQLADEVMSALGALVLQYGIERVQPLLGFLRIVIR